MQFPELNYDFDYSIAEIDDKVSIAYTDIGSADNKETLLFIHGLSSYIPAWLKLIPLLKDHFRCIAIDLPGYGKSSEGVHSGGMDLYADVISRFIQKLNLTNVSLVGHSMGGHISLSTALNYPHLIDKLILIAPAGLETFSEEEKEWIKKISSPEIFCMQTDKQIRYNYEINFVSMPHDVEPMINDRIEMKKWKNYKDYCRIVNNSLNGLLDNPVFEKLNLITQRTLILFGKNDRLIPHSILHKNIIPEQIAQTGAAEFQKAIVSLIEDCGHFMQYEKPEIISGEIINFMAE